ncbi:MAG: glycosyltransferase family 2 protein [Candidatus Omnitrophica bacterium]|nr:glycosyltransferase family 2 protein [Candidatus Omnitrophota bacterium]
MSETISVIIPAYNSAEFIGKAVGSVLAQELLPDEIIVVDDGSDDGTGEVVQKLIAGQGDKNPRIKYIRQANQGPAAARNTGIKNAAGDYIAFLDADDRWLPGRLKMQMKIFRDRPEAGLVCSGRFRINESTGQQTVDCIGKTLSDDSYRDLWTKGNYVTTSSVLARKKCFDAVGGFDEDPRVLGSEDAEMWLRVAEKFPILYVNEPLVEYLVRAGGMNRSNIQRAYESAILAIQKHEAGFRAKYADAGSIVRQRWGRAYHAWGMTLFDAEQFAQSRDKFKMALSFRGFSFQTLQFYLLTLLGQNILGALKKWKKRINVLEGIKG